MTPLLDPWASAQKRRTNSHLSDTVEDILSPCYRSNRTHLRSSTYVDPLESLTSTYSTLPTYYVLRTTICTVDGNGWQGGAMIDGFRGWETQMITPYWRSGYVAVVVVMVVVVVAVVVVVVAVVVVACSRDSGPGPALFRLSFSSNFPFGSAASGQVRVCRPVHEGTVMGSSRVGMKRYPVVWSGSPEPRQSLVTGWQRKLSSTKKEDNSIKYFDCPRDEMDASLLPSTAPSLLVTAFPFFISRASSLGACQNEYIAPSDTDRRAPCPMLNTVTNHGYLPRNGLNISMDDLAQGLAESINLDPAATAIFGAAAVLTSTTGNPNTFNLDDLVLQGPGLIAHDASLSRADQYWGNALTLNTTVWGATAAFFTGPTIDAATAKAARDARIATSKATNPEFDLPPTILRNSAIEWAAILTVFEEPDNDPAVAAPAVTEWIKTVFVGLRSRTRTAPRSRYTLMVDESQRRPSVPPWLELLATLLTVSLINHLSDDRSMYR
ncbi:hypothetical protein MBM_05424 [Drepanopeziza brunnea f. sp. 'multigermtubi' MB_m1]|uniref:Heme haloperoxidase family profile domain-containing protein n=1 Tax=Marssonina brunnea f. sp. multigermtubi (strain MB_m1) TaxID=1072389 RepID=K1WFB8_MARBU|nr:uncharacterized protein MBM_05424 [Drepanopeziza brunnea f. sp. 'multigermtubi' MB_m1]EKD16130.1 hypothetical protein MBM_05424 [Drepanopeziza brunnea f. sp. 'multigermtubi' MB_m1]